MKISVIIPTFKRPDLLIRCLQRLAQQNFLKENFEVIVVTDGPDIATKTAVDYFSKHAEFLNIFCYSLQQKKGPAAARNKGAEYAHGKLLAFTDDDCLTQIDWLHEYWKAYINSDEQEIAFTGKTIVPVSSAPTDYEKNIAHLQMAEFITANCAISKTAFKKVNGFDENFTTAWREDSDLHFKLIQEDIVIKKINTAVVTHPVRSVKWGVSIKEQKKSLFNALLYKKHILLYRQRISATPVFNYYMMILIFGIAIISSIYGYRTISIITFITWLAFVFEFTFRRLKSTSKKITHVAEMLFTSAIIPFLSVFWTLYGSFKYKILFL